MSWAARRRFLILLIVLVVIGAIFAVFYVSFFRPAPSCTDGIQNEGESGVDCGGPCPYLCTAEEQPPVVLFTKAFSNGRGGVDIAASVANKNPYAAAKAVPYSITLYDANQAIVKTLSGTLDLPPNTTEPVYIPNVNTGGQTVTRAFLDISPSAPAWYTLSSDPRILPTVSDVALGGTTDAPRITAALANPAVTPLKDVLVVVFVHDAQGNVIAASQTVLPLIQPQGTAAATFTWNSAFAAPPVLKEVIPVVPLP